MLRIYSVPQDAFESSDDSEESGDSGDEGGRSVGPHNPLIRKKIVEPFPK